MEAFEYKNGELCCDGVPVSFIARQLGTPFYLYSAAAIESNYLAFEHALRGVPHMTCFAVKANSNLAVLNLLKDLGSGFDIVSQGELYRLQQIGADPARILFSGVGKTDEEIAAALDVGVLELNAESEFELARIQQLAAARSVKTGVALRVNPDVDPKTHPYIATGQQVHKFGISMQAAAQIYSNPEKYPQLIFSGISCHIGSQVTDLTPFRDAIANLRRLVLELGERGRALKYLDVGGGLGIQYDSEQPPSIREYVDAVVGGTRDLAMTLLLEPGRRIVGDAGILVSRVLLTKANDLKKFVVIDAAMNDLIRPTLYGAYHRIDPVQSTAGARETVDVVGPVCETGDYLAKDRPLPAVKAGDLLAVRSAGAYGYCQASNYNSRRRIPEVMVQNGEFRVVRERESFQDLIRLERI
ncbi:MAG TPA: diaminopimelate decarboxylase [Acidobacteriota bacterium]|jgi:diaminopimelate decarboxylase